MSTTQSIPNDIGTILRLPTKVTSELTDKACLCIGSAISAAKSAGEQHTAVNIGIGQLSINLIDMQCKFIPSKCLKAAIKDALANNTDPLEIWLEQTFAEKLLIACEEVL